MIFLNIWKKAILFYLGGMGYVGLELLWRRRSHSSMFLLGGLCFLALGRIGRPTPKRMVSGAGIITALELAAGTVVNRQHQVWDYTALPLNYRGQICLPFFLLWIPVAGAGMWLHRQLSQAISHLAER